jgi:hypothetical protein
MAFVQVQCPDCYSTDVVQYGLTFPLCGFDQISCWLPKDTP